MAKNNTLHEVDVKVNQHGKVQTLLARVAVGNPERPVVLQAPAWSDWPGYSREEHKAGTIRDLTDCTVVSVAFPDMGLRADDANIPEARKITRLTKEQRKALRKNGSFDPVSKVQWQAARAVYKRVTKDSLDAKRLWLWGNSMGASGAISLARTAPEDLQIEGIGVGANVALAPWSRIKQVGFARLVHGYMTHGPKEFERYCKLNPPDLKPDEKPGSIHRGVLTQLKGTAWPVWAMAQGRDGDRLEELARLKRYQETRFVLWNGEHDILSPNHLNDQVASRMGGRAVRECLLGEPHAISSVPFVHGALLARHTGRPLVAG